MKDEIRIVNSKDELIESLNEYIADLQDDIVGYVVEEKKLKEEIEEITEILNLYGEKSYNPIGQLGYVIWKLRKAEVEDKDFILKQLEEIRDYYKDK